MVDKSTFQQAEIELSKLQDMDILHSRPAILVGNKIDLARSRAVSSQGKFTLYDCNAKKTKKVTHSKSRDNGMEGKQRIISTLCIFFSFYIVNETKETEI